MTDSMAKIAESLLVEVAAAAGALDAGVDPEIVAETLYRVAAECEVRRKRLLAEVNAEIAAAIRST
jgi:hypothetical protein